MAAKPRIKERAPEGPPEIGAPQIAYHEAAVKLAAALGWDGEPDWVQNDIQVSDAVNYCRKALHEAHQAGARGLDLPRYTDACKHLAVDTVEEQRAFEVAIKAAHEEGKSDEFVEAAWTKYGQLEAAISTSAGQLFGKAAGGK